MRACFGLVEQVAYVFSYHMTPFRDLLGNEGGFVWITDYLKAFDQARQTIRNKVCMELGLL